MSTDQPTDAQPVKDNRSFLQRFIELNPVLLRGILVTVAALIAKFIGREVVDSETIDLIIDLFITVTALITALWARGVVIAENKVIAWKLDPRLPDQIVPGPVRLTKPADLAKVQVVAMDSVRQGEVRSDRVRHIRQRAA